MPSSASWEDSFYFVTNVGFLLGAVLTLVAGILTLQSGRKLAGTLLVAGSSMVAVEMLIWIGDSVASVMAAADPFAGAWMDDYYALVTALGMVGTVTTGAGALVLAFALRSALGRAAQLLEVAARS